MDKPKLYKSICPGCGVLIETCNDPGKHDVYHDLCFQKAGLLVGGKKWARNYIGIHFVLYMGLNKQILISGLLLSMWIWKV